MMMEPIAIVGVAQTHFEQKKPDKPFYDLVFDVTRDALADAGLCLADIGSIVTVSNDFWDGRTISGMAVSDAAGAHDKNVSTVSGDGAFGAFYGAMRVLGGAGTTLVVVHCKGSEGNPAIISNGMFDPIFQRLLGIHSVPAAALQCRQYMDTFGILEEQLAQVSVKNHGNARNNPYAQRVLDITIDDVMASEPVADPLKVLDCSPVSDGAAAVIIADKEAAAKARTVPVWVKGVAHCAEDFFLGDRDLAEPKALRNAAKRAYSMAGIYDPAAQLDVMEVYDAFSYMEPLWLEGLGVAKPGRGPYLIQEGITSMGGTLPVNPSGGVLAGNPVLVAGTSAHYRGDAPATR